MGSRLLKIVAVSLAAVSVSALLLLTLVVAYPRLAINNRTVSWFGPVLRHYDIPLTWSQSRVSVESLSFLKKRFHVEAADLCYARSKPYQRVCLETVSVTFTFHLWSRKLAIENLDIPKASATLEADTGVEPSEPINPFAFVQQLREQITWVQWQQVSVGRFTLLYTDGDHSLRLTCALTGVGQPRTLKLSTQGTLSAKGKRAPIQATASLSLPNEGELGYTLTGSWGASRDSWSLETRGKIAADSLRGILSAHFIKPVQTIQQVQLRECEYQWSEKGRKNHASFHCPDGALRLSSPVGAELTITADLDLDPKASDPFRAITQTNVAQFENLVPLLEDTPWAVPAPLNQLRGTVKLTTQTKADSSFQKIQTTFEGDSLLASKEQSLNFTTQGSFDLTRSARATDALLTADIEFQQTKLSLPRLDPVNMPRLFPDSRIVYPRDTPPSAFTFRDRVTIRTAAGKPLLLRTNQYGAVIPLELDLVHSSEAGLVGHLHTPPFQLEILRRMARVKTIDIGYPREGAPELNSTVEFHYQDYDLTLSAFGKLDSPRYSIASNPPLSENSAWSLLIFGRPLEELTAGQGESLVNARAAITGGAVSALSMYLLASTPVESVGYDPTKGKFMATVRLLEGTSLRIEGVKEGVSSLGIRKRLGRDWVLNTSIERTSPLEDKRSVSTYLDWSHTY